MPDYDFRPSSFVVDIAEKDVVRYIISPTGTLSGPFASKGEVYMPEGKLKDKELNFSPVQVSLTIRDGQVSAMKYGFVVDRLEGNTGGLEGTNALLSLLDEGPNQFSYLPPLVVLKRFFGRSVKTFERESADSVLPEPVLIAIAKEIVAGKLGYDTPDLLASDFQFSGPLEGPLTKSSYLEAGNRRGLLYSAVPDVCYNAYNFVTDNFNPEKVWFMVRATGTMTATLVKDMERNISVLPTGLKAECPPELCSLSINSQGLCYRLTAGYVVDPSQGNTDGLGGIEGIYEGIGAPLPIWETRSVTGMHLLAILTDHLYYLRRGIT